VTLLPVRHLSDEVWSIETGRYLVWDACQLVVNVPSIDETWLASPAIQASSAHRIS
jgi:hypothetical protein